jgi:hypothetical protein
MQRLNGRHERLKHPKLNLSQLAILDEGLMGNLSSRDNGKLEEIRQSYVRFYEIFPEKRFLNVGKVYEAAMGQVKGLDCNALDIERFSLALGAFRDFHYETSMRYDIMWTNSWEFRGIPRSEHPYFAEKCSMIFLGALMNSSKENGFRIHTWQFIHGPMRVGFRNLKRLFVNGETGDETAREMEGGTLTLNGLVRHMKGIKGGKIRAMRGITRIAGAAGCKISVAGSMNTVIGFEGSLQVKEDVRCIKDNAGSIEIFGTLKRISGMRPGGSILVNDDVRLLNDLKELSLPDGQVTLVRVRKPGNYDRSGMYCVVCTPRGNALFYGAMDRSTAMDMIGQAEGYVSGELGRPAERSGTPMALAARFGLDISPKTVDIKA